MPNSIGREPALPMPVEEGRLMEASSAKKYKNGLCCVVNVPAIERFGGRISELQSLAENEWAKSIASPRKKKGGSVKRPASEDDSDQT